MTREGLGGDLLESDVDIDQWMHRLHLPVRNESVVFGDSDEMHEAHVKDLMLVQVVEGILPVAVV